MLWTSRFSIVLGVCCVCMVPTKTVAEYDHVIPLDFANSGGAPEANLEQAMDFAWDVFVGLSWPAIDGRRGVSNTEAKLSTARPVVWETYRNKVEVFPGQGSPPKGEDGFHQSPDYIYDPEKVPGAGDGRTSACSSVEGSSVPFINLDEINQDLVYSRDAPERPYPGQQILVLSKINKPMYDYIVERGWYGRVDVRPAIERTGMFVRQNGESPEHDPMDFEKYISFPEGSMEVKASYRQLRETEDGQRFHLSPVRTYRAPPTGPCHVDSDQDGRRWGMVGFHFAYKTPSAPYFIWATFEHVDTLAGEDLDMPAMNPMLIETRATEKKFQYLEIGDVEALPPSKIYFINQQGYRTPYYEYIDVHKRLHATPDEVTEFNERIARLIEQSAPSSPLKHYRLVSVQWKPLDKEAGAPYDGEQPSAIYYGANISIEAPYTAQNFSGQYSHGFQNVTDFVLSRRPGRNPPPNPGAPTFFNTYFNGEGFLMGGCMGCHGKQQSYGTDWSYIFQRQRVRSPEIPRGSHPNLDDGT